MSTPQEERRFGRAEQDAGAAGPALPAFLLPGEPPIASPTDAQGYPPYPTPMPADPAAVGAFGAPPAYQGAPAPVDPTPAPYPGAAQFADPASAPQAAGYPPPTYADPYADPQHAEAARNEAARQQQLAQQQYLQRQAEQNLGRVPAGESTAQLGAAAQAADPAAAAFASFQPQPNAPAYPQAPTSPAPQAQPAGVDPLSGAPQPAAANYALPDLASARFMRHQPESWQAEAQQDMADQAATPPGGSSAPVFEFNPATAQPYAQTPPPQVSMPPMPAPQAVPGPMTALPPPQATQPIQPMTAVPPVAPSVSYPADSVTVRPPAVASRVRGLDTNTGGLSVVQPFDQPPATQPSQRAPGPISGPIMRPQVPQAAAHQAEAALLAGRPQVPANPGAKQKPDLAQTGSKVMKVIMVVLIVAVIGFAIYLLVVPPPGVSSLGQTGASGIVHAMAASWGQVGGA